MKSTVVMCDRCKKEIEYKGWTAIIRPNPLKRFKITEIFNGNPSGYDYVDDYLELCAECTAKLKAWCRE